MRRRTFLGAALAAGALPVAGCRSGDPDPATDPAAVVVTTERGIVVVREGSAGAPRSVALATADWRWVVAAEPDGDATLVTVRALRTDEVRHRATLPGRLLPRAITPDGRRLALVTAAGPVRPPGLHNPAVVPARRPRTTVVVTEDGAERARLDLPGNLLPDTFSPDGGHLYVYDVAPGGDPPTTRVRSVDLRTGRMATPAGDGRPLAAHWVGAVDDPVRQLRYTLLVDQRGGRAFVRRTDLRDGSVGVIDLPAPFGGERPGVHTLAASPDGRRLCAVYNPAAVAVGLHPDRLAPGAVNRFAEGLPGKPGAAFTASGRLVVTGDHIAVATGPTLRIATRGEARGLALAGDGRAWIGDPDGVSRYDLDSGRELSRVAVPGMLALRHALPGRAAPY
jgi:hypothetical protein